MALSDELISAFVKVTTDQTEYKQEATVYGTIVEHDGTKYVKLDGSDQYTPIDSTADAKPGERVTVLIKNHTATVTGNASSPAARVGSVEEIGNQITRVETLVADKVTVEQLNAKYAEVETLVADKVTVEQLNAKYAEVETLVADKVTTEQLNAKYADVEELIAGKLDASVAKITYATIDNLTAANAKIYNIESTYAKVADLDATYAKITDLDATYAKITDLDATYAKITDLDATYAKITELNATNAKIGTLDAKVGKIDSLDATVAKIDDMMFGEAGGNVIQTKFSNSVIANLGEAWITSAMIKDLDASKINAGFINTNAIAIKSAENDEDLVISGGTIQIRDGVHARVQIGKDKLGDYSFNIWDDNGNLIFREGGITGDAIKDAIIVDNMISDEANISAGKLDISGLFEEINKEDNTYILKSSKILMDADEQTLEVAFNAMKEDMESQGTNLKVVKGAIEGRIWKQDITIGGRNLILDSASSTHTRTNTTNNWLTNPDGSLYSWSNSDYGIASLADGEEFTLSFDYDITGITYACDAVVGLRCTSNGLYEALENSISLAEGDNSGHYSYTFKPSEGMKQNGTMWTLLRLGEGKNEGAVFTFTNIKFEKGNTPTDWTPAPEDMASAEDMDSVITRMETAETSIKQNSDAIELRATKTELTTLVADTAIGGRNLILDSAVKTHTRTNATSSWFKKEEDGKLYAWHNSDYCIVSIADGGKFTLSFDYEISGITAACNMVPCLRATSSFSHDDIGKSIPLVVGDNAGHYSHTFEPSDGMKQYGTQWIISGLGEGKNEGAEFTFTNIKFEKGDKATYWTPAPEDMDSVIMRMETAETSIKQNTEAINLRATKTELTTLEDNVSKNYCTLAEAAEISLKTDAIESTVKQTYATKSEVADTAIGGRNLILDSACSTHTRTNTTNKWLNEENGSLYVWRNSEYGIDAIADGGKFTLSFDYKVDGITTACNMVPCLRATDSSLYTDIDKSIPLAVGNNAGHYSRTFEPSDGMKQYGTQWIISGLGEGKNEGAVFTFTNIKFEKGDKATYWTPAPEDMDSVIERMETAETSIKQNADAIALSVKNISENYYTIKDTEAAIGLKANEITSTVSENYATKSEVDGITIGGRNFILDSAVKTHTRTDATSSWFKEDNKLYVWRNSNYCIDAISNGGKFTLSFDYEISGITSACNMYPCLRSTSSNAHANIDEPIRLVVGDNAGHYSCTFEPSDGMKQYGTQWIISGLGEGKNEGAVFTFTNIKFEKGTKATDWTPAPEDIETRLSNAESRIEQTAEKIKVTVTKEEFENTVGNIKIGGRNLIPDSATSTHTRTNTANSWLTNVDGTMYGWRNSDYCMSALASGGEFTLSFDYNITGITTACNASICLRHSSAGYYNGIGKTLPLSVGSNSGHYSHTFTPTDGMKQYGTRWGILSVGEGKNEGAVFTFTNIKFEKGNKATDWTPAPEDISANHYTKTETNTLFEQTNKSITLTVQSEIEDLHLGSVNEIRNSDDLIFDNYYFTGSFVVTHDGKGNVTVTCGASVIADEFGHVTMNSAATTTHDGAGNVTTK